MDEHESYLAKPRIISSAAFGASILRTVAGAGDLTAPDRIPAGTRALPAPRWP
jgi:hypothetical protein